MATSDMELLPVVSGLYKSKVLGMETLTKYLAPLTLAIKTQHSL